MKARTAFLVSLIFITGCNYRMMKTGTQGALPNFTAEQLSYDLVKGYVFDPKCTGCHGTSGGVNLQSYSEVIKNLEAIKTTVFIKGTMPKASAGALTSDQMQLLSSWIQQGAPEFGKVPVTLPTPVALEPKFKSIYNQIFARKCTECHNPKGKAKDDPLETPEDLINSFDELVVPGDPDNSYLVIVISPGARKPMPPLDSGMSSVTPNELSVIREWIKNGAKD